MDNKSDNPDHWRQRCSELGLDPQELKAVSSRYDMYRSYSDEHGGNTLPLARWYKWYRVEKLADGHATRTPPAAGCSVGAETLSQSSARESIISEADFLELLELYRAGPVPD